MPIRPNLFKFQAVLFDVDGTLVDSLYCITQGLGDTIQHFRGYRPDDAEIRSLVGMPLLKQMAIYAENASQANAMASLAIERMTLYHDEEKAFESSVECLRYCSSHGIKTALVTSKNAVELFTFLNRFEARKYVDATVCASDVSQPKPSPESAFLACELLGVMPADCAFVGDSIYDMRCGRGAGMTCIAVAYGAGSRSTLEAEAPDLLFDTPEELLAWAHETSPLITCPEKN